MYLFAIIIGSKYAMSAKIRERYKIIILAVLHSVIYCLVYQAYDFIQWTIRFHKVTNYPYRYPFAFLVIIYCIISFIILGVLLYMRYKKADRIQGEYMEKTDFIRCPVCGNKTRDKIREDTVLKNFPLFCPKCKRECLIDVEQFHITVIKAPDAQPQSR